MSDIGVFPPSGGGWKKYEGNPVFGSEKTGTCFDVLVLPETKGDERAGYKMYFSWRPKKSLAVTTSQDGISWEEPRIILEPNPVLGWQDDLNRNAVVEKDGKLHMWFTGQSHLSSPSNGYSRIGYATATDDSNWVCIGEEPVLIPEQPWEGTSVMCPSVLWDEDQRVFRMWYSAGETYEPNVICYAVSADGVNWRKHRANPIFVPDRNLLYERERIGGCQVVRYRDGYLMFYIGYENIDTARICAAWSPNGISQWKRFGSNPLVSPEPGKWDGDACYKPSIVYDGEKDRWLLWYNGRNKAPEYIGLAIHEGWDLEI